MEKPGKFMMKLHKLVATVCGIGYIGKGGGTIAAAVFCLVYFTLPADYHTNFLQVLMVIIVSAIGVWSGNAADATWGKDSNKVVIDEAAGMMITLLFIPAQVKLVLTGLILFRFFDIAKPLLIRKTEALPKGWGVMADDLLAGIYANLILQVILIYRLL